MVQGTGLVYGVPRDARWEHDQTYKVDSVERNSFLIGLENPDNRADRSKLQLTITSSEEGDLSEVLEYELVFDDRRDTSRNSINASFSYSPDDGNLSFEGEGEMLGGLRAVIDKPGLPREYSRMIKRHLREAFAILDQRS